MSWYFRIDDTDIILHKLTNVDTAACNPAISRIYGIAIVMGPHIAQSYCQKVK